MPSAPRRPLAKAPRAPAREHPSRGLLGHFTRRVDLLTSVFLLVPLFVVYQLGILLGYRCSPGGACSWTANGMDFGTRTLLEATHGSLLAYVSATFAIALALVFTALWSRRRSQLHPRLFVPVVLESSAYALLTGVFANTVVHSVGLMGAGRGGGTYLDDVVASCGAGLHEELFFRAGLFAGGAWLLGRAGMSRRVAVALAAVASAVLFSAVHHLGALGEPFTVTAFVFRIAAGLFFTLVYGVRGLGVAAWTHCLYDICVFTLQRSH